MTPTERLVRPFVLWCSAITVFWALLGAAVERDPALFVCAMVSAWAFDVWTGWRP